MLSWVELSETGCCEHGLTVCCSALLVLVCVSWVVTCVLYCIVLYCRPPTVTIVCYDWHVHLMTPDCWSTLQQCCDDMNAITSPAIPCSALGISRDLPSLTYNDLQGLTHPDLQCLMSLNFSTTLHVFISCIFLLTGNIYSTLMRINVYLLSTFLLLSTHQLENMLSL